MGGLWLAVDQRQHVGTAHGDAAGYAELQLRPQQRALQYCRGFRIAQQQIGGAE
jgi:hypothetical protein